MSAIKYFHQLNKGDVAIAGGKGASLGEMTHAKIPVPPGFVIVASAFDKYLRDTDLTQEIEAQFDQLNYDDTASVERASSVIRDLIHDAAFPRDLKKEVTRAFQKLQAKFVATRSSATAEDSTVASFAGELETYLNTTQKTLFENIKKCWSSLFTPRAIAYRNERGLRKSHVSVAVVIQKMVQSEISGIAFTVHPVTKDPNQMIIEACFGLGELIVGGVVTPDSYVLDKRDSTLIDINVTPQKEMLVRGVAGNKKIAMPKTKMKKQKLDGRQIRTLANICLAIEKHYGFPCDIEWAYEKKKFYIVQSRPITTL